MEKIKRYLPLAMLSLAAAITFSSTASRLAPMASDDSFIHRRIAYNLLHFGKPYYNLGERVMVTSSPLWTILLTVVSAALPTANPAPILEIFFLVAGAAAAYLLVQDRSEGRTLVGMVGLPVLAFLCFCIGDFSVAIDQMETPGAVALILLGFLGLRGGAVWGIAVLAVACLMRYECIPLFICAAALVTCRRAWTRSSALACAFVVLAGAGWLLWEFHTVIPNTVIAKSHAYRMTMLRSMQFTIESRTAGFVYAIFFLLWWLNRKRVTPGAFPVALFLVGFGILLDAAYISRETFVFPWYRPLIYVPVAIGMLVGTDNRDPGRAMAGAICGFMLLFTDANTCANLLKSARHGLWSGTAAYVMGARVHEYQRIGSALRVACPRGTLMTSEIGGLGWGFQGEILDGAGLASPDAIKYNRERPPAQPGQVEGGDIPAAYVLDRRPDLIVSYDRFAPEAIPAARAIGYKDYIYPILTREDRGLFKDVLGATTMHVLVAPNGACSPTVVDEAVRAALER